MILNINSEKFSYYFPNNPHQFISEEFITLNKGKVDAILYLVQDVKKVQLGLIAGVRNGVLLSPFSAPFGGFHFKNDKMYPEVIESFMNDLFEYTKAENITQIKITLPPNIYSQSLNAKMVNVFTRLGLKMETPEITNWVNLNEFQGVFTHAASRTYYNQAVKNKLEFKKVDSIDEMELIYNLIVDNRARMGRSIFMTFEDLLNTAEIFETDYFRVNKPDGELVAGAIFYRAHEHISYAVFWGDTIEGRPVRAMDFLIYNLWSFYKAQNFKFIDLGTSTESGVPNEGLLRFKETHECDSSLRYSFTWS